MLEIGPPIVHPPIVNFVVVVVVLLEYTNHSMLKKN